MSGHECYQVKCSYLVGHIGIQYQRFRKHFTFCISSVSVSESKSKSELDGEREQGISASTHHGQECAAQSSVFTSR